MENYLVSSLIPFIDEGEIAYYGQLTTDVLALLISLAPFVRNSEDLRKLSKLSIEELGEASAILPIMEESEKEAYFNQLVCD